MNFYVKNEDGEFVEPNETQIEEFFKKKSDSIIAKKIGKKLKEEREKLRAELDEQLRQEVGESIKAEARKELETEYQTKIQEAESNAKDLDIKLRRKTIAAEYGFSPDAEQFLGDGSDEDMRTKADTLKNSFGNNGAASKPMDKKTGEPVSTGCVTLTGSE